MELTKANAKVEFVESAGLYFERLGLSRTASRAIGWLLVSVDGSADAPQLCAELKVAKSSMSVALRQLGDAGLVERYRSPGGRRDRFRLADDVFGRAFRVKLADFDRVRDLVERGRRVVGDDSVPGQRLQRMAEMYAFMAEEFPKLLDQWERRQRSRKPS